MKKKKNLHLHEYLTQKNKREFQLINNELTRKYD